MTVHYVDKETPGMGSYQIAASEEGWRWEWSETVQGKTYPDESRWFPTAADAYRDAADDWESNGSPSSNRRLAAQLRAAATRAEKNA